MEVYSRLVYVYIYIYITVCIWLLGCELGWSNHLITFYKWRGSCLQRLWIRLFRQSSPALLVPDFGSLNPTLLFLSRGLHLKNISDSVPRCGKKNNTTNLWLKQQIFLISWFLLIPSTFLSQHQKNSPGTSLLPPDLHPWKRGGSP